MNHQPWRSTAQSHSGVAVGSVMGNFSMEVPRWIRHPSGQWAVAFQLSFCRFSFVFVVFLSPRFAFFAAFVLFVAVLFVSFRFSSFVVFVAVSFVRFSSLFFSFPFVPFVASRRQLQSNVRLIAVLM